jgi:beta-glucanase (GH16 family)
MKKYKTTSMLKVSKSLLLMIIAICLIPKSSNAATATVLLNDTFTPTAASTTLWHIPTWTGPTDGTYIGRTQLRVTQNAQMPVSTNGIMTIPVQTYNPIQGVSFYGTDLISNQSFSIAPKQGLDIKFRAKNNSPLQRGTVGGMFLYALKPGSNTLHDEIDFEILGNWLHDVQTNIYANEPLGAGHFASTTYATGTAATWHLYEIKWLPTKVQWLIDGAVVRTNTANVPTGPMSLHLNEWVPDSGWAAAYDSTLQATTTASANKIYSMGVDYVKVQTIPLQ